MGILIIFSWNNATFMKDKFKKVKDVKNQLTFVSKNFHSSDYITHFCWCVVATYQVTWHKMFQYKE